MRPTRRTQPYRKGPRHPGAALNAMRGGRTLTGLNPQDVRRRTQKMARRRGLGGVMARRA